MKHFGKLGAVLTAALLGISVTAALGAQGEAGRNARQSGIHKQKVGVHVGPSALNEKQKQWKGPTVGEKLGR